METVILNKIESIEKCIKRIKETKSREGFALDNFDFQDIVLLNLQRACQQSIDLAMYIVSQKRLGLPKNSRDAFKLLVENKIITSALGEKLSKMVGFRNTIILEYQEIEVTVIDYILKNSLNDFTDFTKEIISFLSCNNLKQ